MEKLQAALARAREKRDGSGESRPQQSKEASPRKQREKQAHSEALTSLWQSVELARPSSKELNKRRVFTQSASEEASAFDILRTKLLLEMRRNDWTRIALTSSTPGLGKTTLSCNLIAGLGRQPETRGMLFDFDMRRPSISKTLALSPRASLSDFLEGKAAFEDNALRLDSNTIVCGQPKHHEDPGSLISRASTEEAIDSVQARFQPNVMFFDLPPIMSSPEVRNALKMVDAAIIVAGAEQSTLNQIDECEREVAAYTQVAGIVLNKCRYNPEGYAYDY